MSISADIKKTLGNFHLDVRFQADTEILSLLGDSGCGKTLTLKCIAGIERPDEGKIVINGRTVFDSEAHINLPPQQRRVGYLFQNYALFPNMTLLGNIMTGLEREKGLTREQRRKKAEEYIRKFRLDGLESHRPDQLSGGQQQRAALARILASDPDLLLLDEPFSALDATLRWQMETLVRQTIDAFPGTTILVSHDRDEVYRLSNRVAVYRNGEIDRCGEKADVFNDPVTATTARLTGCKNLSPAHREGNELVAEAWDIRFPLKEDDAGEWNYVGIRAHRFQLTDDPTGCVFPFEVVSRIEDTFSYILQIRKSGGDGELLRWEADKNGPEPIPDRGLVRVPEGELLLLREN